MSQNVGTAVDALAVRELAAEFRGELVLPADPGYRR